ncbi:MAG: hypothetical protein ACMG57_01960 [Candidatus Dojkabacteria bacterium]
MIFFYSFIHFFFALLGIFAWFSIDRKRDYKRYFKVSIIIGVCLGLLFDFVLSGIFNFFSYSSTNILEYIVILFSTYVIGTPFIIETLEFFVEKLKFVKIKGFKALTSDFYYTELLISLIVSGCLFVYGLINILNPEGILFFIIGFISLTFLSDAILGIHLEDGLVTRLLKGYYLTPIAVLISGLLVGFLWEFLNINLRLWTYTNLPGDSILGIPIVVLIFWGTLNLTFWTAAKVLSKYIQF